MDWVKLVIGRLHDLYLSLNTTVNKSRKIRLDGHGVRMGISKNA